MRRAVLIACVTLLVSAGTLAAQQGGPLSRRQAIEIAVTKGPRLPLAAADTFSAFGQLLSARGLLNPALSASYTKSTPQYHVIVDLPFDYPGLRSSRIQSAEAARVASQFRYRFERAAIELGADTAYTIALASQLRARLSRRTALDADSLLHMAMVRRDAGDASDLDVELARVVAGRQATAAAMDSLDYIAAVLDLQAIMGLPPDRPVVELSDTLAMPEAGPDSVSGTPLLIAAAGAMADAADLAVKTQQRSVFATPSLSGGFESHDPTGAEPGLLPTVGISLPLPLLNQNKGPIAAAQADAVRAHAELDLTRREVQARIASAIRERDQAMLRISRDRTLVESARRVEAMSLVAYREGASNLAGVLEAQRNARELVAQYITDLATGWNTIAILRTLTTPAGSVAP